MSDDYNATVIGAGHAGLSSAATLQRGGRRTLLLERRNVPSGAATSSVRGRFEFEMSLHQLGGMGNGPLRQVLDQLDVTRRLTFVEERDLYRTVLPGVLDITLPAEWQGVADVLEDSFPGNRARVESFLGLCHEVGSWQLVARASLHQAQEQAAWLHGLSRVRRNGLRPAKEVLDEYFDDDRITHVLASYWSDNGQPPSTLPFMDLARILTLYLEYKPYHVRGGSQATSSAMLDSFLEAGGDVRFNSDVAEIRTHQGAVVGVRLVGGDDTVDHVISEPDAGWPGPTRFLSAAVVERLVGPLRGRMTYVCGPPAMYAYQLRQLDQVGHSRRRVRLEASGIALPAGDDRNWPADVDPTAEVTVTVRGRGAFRTPRHRPCWTHWRTTASIRSPRAGQESAVCAGPGWHVVVSSLRPTSTWTSECRAGATAHHVDRAEPVSVGHRQQRPHLWQVLVGTKGESHVFGDRHPHTAE